MDMFFRVSEGYWNGATKFVDCAFSNASEGGKILCPCVQCNNCLWQSKEDTFDHIICQGFCKKYTRWIFHGEASSSVIANESFDSDGRLDDMHELLQDAFHGRTLNDDINDQTSGGRGECTEAKIFYKLMEYVQQDLYTGCQKFSKLSFMVRLFQIKYLGGWTDKSFTLLLELLKEVLPEEARLPPTFYECKKIIRDLGLSYDKIHACPNDCMLFWKSHVKDDNCGFYGASRWKKPKEQDSGDNELLKSEKENKVPAKVLRHFPLKARLQRLFLSPEGAQDMTWHEEGRTKDEILRHSADSPAFKTFNH